MEFLFAIRITNQRMHVVYKQKHHIDIQSAVGKWKDIWKIAMHFPRYHDGVLNFLYLFCIFVLLNEETNQNSRKDLKQIAVIYSAQHRYYEFSYNDVIGTSL